MIQILKREKKFLIFLFLFSFLIRGLFFGLFLSKDKNYCGGDSSSYYIPAIQLAEGKGLVNLDNSPLFFRLPGYPFFLALGYWLFDFDNNKTLWLQIFIASFIPLLIFCLSLVLFPLNLLLAKVCSLYSAFHSGFLICSGLLHSEALFIFFLLFFFILFFLRFYFLAGIFLGMASLIRAVGPYVICLSILILLFYKIGFFEKLKKEALFFIGWLLIVFGWLLRNWILTGYIFFHTLSGTLFLLFPAAYIVANAYNLPYEEAKKKLKYEVGKGDLRKIETCLRAEQIALKYIRKHPFLFFKQCLNNILRTTFIPFSSELFLFIENKYISLEQKNRKSIFYTIKNIFFSKSLKQANFIICLELVISLFLWIGFCGFLINSFYDKNTFFVMIKVFPFICLFLFMTLASGLARLRLPIEPLFFIPAFHFWLKRLKF